MGLIQHKPTTKFHIRAAGARHVLIGEREHRTSLAFSATEMVDPWHAEIDQVISDEALEVLLAFKPDLVLIGVGQERVLPDMRVLGYFLSRRIGCEMMNLQSCARTFNVLVSEGRNVVAGLVL